MRLRLMSIVIAGLAALFAIYSGSANLRITDEKVHDALMRNPRWLQEMNVALAQDMAREAIEQNHAALFDDPRDPFIGNPKGAVTLVEFFDHRCPWCKAVEPDLAKLLAADPDVRIVFKDIAGLGDVSLFAGKAALAAQRQGKYAEFHKAVLGDKQPADQDRILKLAGDAGVDVEQMKKDMEDPAIAAQIDDTRHLGATVGAQGTPAFIVGNSFYAGVMNYDALVKAVAAGRAYRPSHATKVADAHN